MKKIFNDSGFLTPEAKPFINDGFIKSAKEIFDTAEDEKDIRIIQSILSKLVGDLAAYKINSIK